MPQCSFSLSIGTPMELSKKIKIALDETRILILGAQILLGFQFRGVFSDGYEQLPTHARYLDGVALGLMVCVVGLLITPGPYHRIVEGGEDSGNFHRLVTVIADLALLPLALALGLDLLLQPAVFSGMWQVPPLELQPLQWRSGSGTDSPDCESDIAARRSAQ